MEIGTCCTKLYSIEIPSEDHLLRGNPFLVCTIDKGRPRLNLMSVTLDNMRECHSDSMHASQAVTRRALHVATSMLN